MSTTPTTNYGWLYPDDGTEEDTWGPILNTLFEDVDNEVFDIDGRVTTLETGGATAEIIQSSGSGTLDLAAGRHFQVTVSTGGVVTATMTGLPTSDLEVIESTVIFLVSGAGGTPVLAVDSGVLIWAGTSAQNAPPDMRAAGRHKIHLTTWQATGPVDITVASYLGRITTDRAITLTGAGDIEAWKSPFYSVSIDSAGNHNLTVQPLLNDGDVATVDIHLDIPASGRTATFVHGGGGVQTILWDANTVPLGLSVAQGGLFSWPGGGSPYWVRLYLVRLAGTTRIMGTRARSPFGQTHT
jgi:hypothetical protein